MMHENQEYEYRTNNTRSILAGMLVGGLAGAAAMLLLAPQSGKDTRKQIQQKGTELRDRTSEVMEDTMTQVREKANKLSVSGRDAIQELTEKGQKIAVEGLDRASEAVKSTKTSVQNA